MALADYADVLPAGTIDAWPKIAGVLPAGSILMGGTGLAVWLRHRLSEDLDFFVPVRLEARSITTALSDLGAFHCDAASDRMIRGTFEDVMVDIVSDADEFRLGPAMSVGSLLVGSLQDVTAAKYRAIIDRKQLRDFVDVMRIETHGGITIEQGILLYLRRHAIDFDLEAVRGFLRHLTDFRYLHDDPAMTAAFGPAIRDTVTSFFRNRHADIVAAFSQLLADDDPSPAT
ncbi:MAG: nucleotidyl transferase AbiEii/AbiGii toxin family protein [bacterium]|nr:nucleotidyl transferase AbiEii/AbiGii toxin family protein [bacterium]